MVKKNTMAIQTSAKIKKAVLKDNGVDIQFAELGIDSDQVRQVNDMIRSKSMVNITIETVQKDLPFKEDE